MTKVTKVTKSKKAGFPIKVPRCAKGLVLGNERKAISCMINEMTKRVTPVSAISWDQSASLKDTAKQAMGLIDKLLSLQLAPEQAVQLKNGKGILEPLLQHQLRRVPRELKENLSNTVKKIVGDAQHFKGSHQPSFVATAARTGSNVLTSVPYWIALGPLLANSINFYQEGFSLSHFFRPNMAETTLGMASWALGRMTQDSHPDNLYRDLIEKFKQLDTHLDNISQASENSLAQSSKHNMNMN